MNFEELVKPYAENGRTVAGQIKWLLSKGIPKDIVDQAILRVYDELDRGKILEDGYHLDRYLLDTVRNMQVSSAEKQVRELERFMTAFKDRWSEEYKNQNKPGVWQRIKAVFRP